MMKSIIHSSSKKAAMIVGIAFICSAFIVTLVDDILLANFVVPGDTQALAKDIEGNKTVFHYAVLGYFIVLILDFIIGLALYAVLRPSNRKLASVTAALRLLYAITLAIGLIVLILNIIDVYDYSALKQIGYLFFALHIFTLGYATIKTGYIPKSLGVLLIVASLTYAVFFMDLGLPETLEMIIMLTMLLAELLLSIWLILKRNTLPEFNG